MRLYVLTAVWSVLAASGMLWIFDYEATPGPAIEPPPMWPNNSAVQLDVENRRW